MTHRDERRFFSFERPFFSSSPSTFGILDEWAEDLAAADAEAQRGALAHRTFAEAYWEARVSAAA